MENILFLTEREIIEIKHCLLYRDFCNHGTVGHNLLVLVAKLAEDKGFYLGVENELATPENVRVSEK